MRHHPELSRQLRHRIGERPLQPAIAVAQMAGQQCHVDAGTCGEGLVDQAAGG